MTAPRKLRAVMLVDDEEIDQMLYRRVIGRSGLVEKVYGFRYAEQALEFLRDPGNEPIDVIFLDINMPCMNGFEFLQRAQVELNQDFAKAVVVMLTTSLDPQDYQRAQSFDVIKYYVIKPLTVEHIGHVVALVARLTAET